MKVGDKARVIAGSPVYEDNGTPTYSPKKQAFGLPLKITKVEGTEREVSIGETGIDECIGSAYLEPWNDKEHWDGQKWAANPSCEPVPVIPDSVWVGGIEYIRKVDVETPKLTMAEEYAKWLIDATEEECKVWDEEGNLKFTTKTISATADGDLVTIVERVVSME